MLCPYSLDTMNSNKIIFNVGLIAIGLQKNVTDMILRLNIMWLSAAMLHFLVTIMMPMNA